MRTLFLGLAASATILATGVIPVAASEYRYCLHGDDYAAMGDCGYSYQQCQATASGRAAYCEANPHLANAAVVTNPAKRRRH
jgi:Protein of unknown function (DUF3551)